MDPRRFLLVVVLILGACRGSDPYPFELIRSESFYSPPWPLLAGGGPSDVIGYTYWNGYGSTILQLARHDPGDPDALIDLGTVTYPGTLGCLAISGTRAVLGCGSTVTVVDFSGSGPAVASITLGLAADHVVAEGRWLLAAAGEMLELVDLDQPTSHFAYTASAPVTSILPAQGDFLSFTSAGYVHVAPDAMGPAFTETLDATLRSFEAGFTDGLEAVVAGPSAAVGQSRIARLDLSSLAAPVLLRSAQFAGTYGAFAWDGAGTSILEILGSAGTGIYEGYLIRERDDGFTGTGVPIPNWWPGIPTHVAARAGHLFIMNDAAGTQLSIYRIR